MVFLFSFSYCSAEKKKVRGANVGSGGGGGGNPSKPVIPLQMINLISEDDYNSELESSSD